MTRTTRRSSLMATCGLLGWMLLGLATPGAEAQLAGIDVSNDQGTVNWTSVKNAKPPNSFGFAKATEGTT